MSMDFADFLLNYRLIFFLKRSDFVNMAFSLIAIFIGMVAMVISIQISVPNTNWITTILIIILAGLGIMGSPFAYINQKIKKNNNKIFGIEKVIIRNYDYINGKSDSEKDCILEEFKQVFFAKKDEKRLLEMLTKN